MPNKIVPERKGNHWGEDDRREEGSNAIVCCEWTLNDSGGSESIFGQAFLTLTWKLMC